MEEEALTCSGGGCQGLLQGRVEKKVIEEKGRLSC